MILVIFPKFMEFFSGTSFQLTKTYDGTNSTASASFFTSSPTVSGASGAVPTGTSISLSSPTFTYDDVNQKESDGYRRCRIFNNIANTH